jgi:RNA-binding protein
MKRAGIAEGVAQGVLVVRSNDDEYPDVGTDVIDDSLDTVGHVVDVFGPVDRPYLTVSPHVDQPALVVGEALYARD